MTHFDLAAPLPKDPLLLEASAGTGKTWTIAALTTRFLAEEGLGVDEVLLITFTNKAARELRSRVFSRIHGARDALVDHQRTGRTPDDQLCRLLSQRDVPLRIARLEKALADFDRSTFTTIHSFCESMLKELGVLGDWDAGDQVLRDTRPMIDQCAVEVYLTRYSNTEACFDAKQALTIARAACGTALPLSPPGSERAAYCDAVRQRFEDRRRSLGMVTFDDMPGRLRQLLADPGTGESAKQALRDRFRLVMVDEFQDTDPVQWELIRLAFVAPGRPTVLIGDPKQSIYGFRGADLESYLEAARSTEKRTLPTNHRSDPAVVEGVGCLFGNAALGDADVRVTPVETKHPNRFDSGATRAGVWIRRAEESALLETTSERAIAADVIFMVSQLLANGRIGDAPLRVSDIAILTRTGQTASELIDALRQAHIPATSAGTENVLRSKAATQWERLLAAMADTRRSTVVMAACTDLLGFDLGRLASPGDASDQAHQGVRQLVHHFEQGGIPAVLATLTEGWDLHARILALADGERRLTDLLHMAELLAMLPGNVQEVLQGFRRLRRDASPENSNSRMSSDADAVRVMTLHAAKGLEFPVVLIPDLSNLRITPNEPFQFTHEGRRMLHIGGKLDHRDPARDEYFRQSREEELRLLYVGLTRAEHLAIAWHVNGKRSDWGALTALLGRDRNVPAPAGPIRRLPGTAALRAAFRDQQTAVELVSVTDFGVALPTPAPKVQPDRPRLAIATARRVVDQTWRRTSYSGLTAGLHESPHPQTTDEPDMELDAEVAAVPPDPRFEVVSPMAGLTGGAAFGTLVHAVFEDLDWTQDPLETEAARVVPRLADRFGLEAEATASLSNAVVAACTTPLGGLAPGQALADFPLADRLPELDFDLPLGDRGVPATVAEVARLMAELLPEEDPLAAYPEHLAVSSSATEVLNGTLTGSIDAVLRTRGGRFLVVDYKTNRFPTAPDEELTVGHYRYPAMTEAMIQAHYPLQALLYCAALHRYLSWRLPRYRPEEHLGGVGYLFVRGMSGPDTPEVDGHVCGVFGWHPPPALVTATSELLGGTR